MKVVIAFGSPAGSTRKVAEMMAKRFDAHHVETDLIDIFAEPEMAQADNVCLCLGSPVYRDVAIPPVMQFIDRLPVVTTGWAVPFVTWGGACSGVALWQMYQALNAKGFQIVGAAKVAAEHSMTWQADNPIGKGRPNEDDRSHVDGLIDTLVARLRAGNAPQLNLNALDYQPDALAAEMKAGISAPWKNIPKAIDPEACTQCGTCADDCPAQTIELDPLPVFGDACFDCFSCIRDCPENAITPKMPLSKINAMIRQRIETIGERPLTEIFI